MPKRKQELTEKQKLFVKEYIVDLNATQAYLRSYGGGYDVAKNEGPKLLAKPCIQEALQKEMEKRNKRLEVDQDDVMRKLIRNLARAMGEEKMFKSERVIKDGKIQNVDKEIVDVDLRETTKILELMGKHVGMFKDNVVVENRNLDEIIEAIKKEKDEARKNSDYDPNL